MTKNETLKMKLREVQFNFDKEKYEVSLIELEAAGKLIINALNAYNKKY